MQLPEFVCFDIVSEHWQSALLQIIRFDWEYCPLLHFSFYLFIELIRAYLSTHLLIHSTSYLFADRKMCFVNQYFSRLNYSFSYHCAWVRNMTKFTVHISYGLMYLEQTVQYLFIPNSGLNNSVSLAIVYAGFILNIVGLSLKFRFSKGRTREEFWHLTADLYSVKNKFLCVCLLGFDINLSAVPRTSNDLSGKMLPTCL